MVGCSLPFWTVYAEEKWIFPLNIFLVLSAFCCDSVCAWTSWLVASALPACASRSSPPPSIKLAGLVWSFLDFWVGWTLESSGKKRGRVGQPEGGRFFCSQAESWIVSTKTSKGIVLVVYVLAQNLSYLLWEQQYKESELMFLRIYCGEMLFG